MEETVYLWDHETADVELYAASIGEFIENEKNKWLIQELLEFRLFREREISAIGLAFSSSMNIISFV